jgi:hypothetical protein
LKKIKTKKYLAIGIEDKVNLHKMAYCNFEYSLQAKKPVFNKLKLFGFFIIS